MEQLEDKAARFRIPIKDSIDPEILGAYVRTQILPLRILRIVGRLHWIGTNMAESTRHAHSIRPHQILRQVVTLVGVIPHRIPFLRSLFIEVGIWKKA